jgi:hypothetical protein
MLIEDLRQSGRRDSNPRRPAWEAGILPLNYARVREGTGTIEPDVQNHRDWIGLDPLRHVNVTSAWSISNTGFEAHLAIRVSKGRICWSGWDDRSPAMNAANARGIGSNLHAIDLCYHDLNL